MFISKAPRGQTQLICIYSSNTASKGRCQWLIWKRCDRLIIFHLPWHPTTLLLHKSHGPGNSHCVQTAGRASISSSSFHLAGPWAFARGSDAVSHVKLTIKHNVMHCACMLVISAPLNVNHPLSDDHSPPAALWFHCQPANVDFLGSVMSRSETSLPLSQCILLSLLVVG